MKEYPPRPPEPVNVKLCECGHVIYDHKGWDYNNTKKECKKCMCPEYKYETTMTEDEYFDKHYHEAVK